MKYISTRKNHERVSFETAVKNGLTDNGGLYFPEYIPKLETSFFDNIESKDDRSIAFEVLKPFVHDSLSDRQLEQVISETLSFPTPVVSLEKNIHILELFHGPTKAFKDVGARFMSRCLSHFYGEAKEEVTILVATSGDTGSAVANGFFNVPGVRVKILFPKGKISPYQEHQMTSLGGNILAIEVEGTFDDCQNLVKQAFNDQDLRKELILSSANSINAARFLPQMLYYFFAWKQLKDQIGDKQFVVSVPSGNLGNLTAGLIAKKMGLPISHFVSALNANDTFLRYLDGEEIELKRSVQTLSNAMDVGNPSNLERVDFLYNGNLQKVRDDITAFSFNDQDTLNVIIECYQDNQYLLDPHGAVGKLALGKILDDEMVGLFLETAHPIKFAEAIQKVIPGFKPAEVDLSECSKVEMPFSYEKLRELLTDH